MDTHDYPARHAVGLGRPLTVCRRCATTASVLVAEYDPERPAKVARFLSRLTVDGE